MKLMERSFQLFLSLLPFVSTIVILSFFLCTFLILTHIFNPPSPPSPISSPRFKKPPSIEFNQPHQYVFSSYPSLSYISDFLNSPSTEPPPSSASVSPSPPQDLPFPYIVSGHIFSEDHLLLILTDTHTQKLLFCQIGDIISGWKLQAFNPNNIIFQHQKHPSLFKKFPII